MAVYRCVICGAIWDEEKEGKPLSELDACPVCKQPISKFEKIEDTPAKPETSAVNRRHPGKIGVQRCWE